MAALESFGSIEGMDFIPHMKEVADTLSDLHKSFELNLDPLLVNLDKDILPAGLGILDLIDIQDEKALIDLRPSIMHEVEKMLDGYTTLDGSQALSLIEVSEWKIDPKLREQCMNQHSGYAAEIISTAKENILACAENTGLTTYRADDRPDLGFSRNDQYVDKIRVNEAGEIVERIQTKFVGKDGADWVQKMVSKKYEKYFDGIHVDKIECPKDYFDDAKADIIRRRDKLGKQLDRVIADGKDGVAEAIRARIERLNKLDDMIERSVVTRDEARYTVKHPKRYASKAFATDPIKMSLDDAASSAAVTAGLTFVTSTVIHGSELLNGEISLDEMAREVVTEVGTAGLIDGAGEFISTAVASSMQTSSCNLIRTVGGSCLPAAAVTFAVESYDSVMDYATGTIDANELAHDLGKNASTIAGGAAAGAKAGAVAGSMFGPAGTAAGGLIGGMVGSAVACGAYETVVQHAPEAAQAIAKQIETSAGTAMDVIANEYPDKVDGARAAFNDFFASNNVPVRV